MPRKEKEQKDIKVYNSVSNSKKHVSGRYSELKKKYNVEAKNATEKIARLEGIVEELMKEVVYLKSEIRTRIK